MSDHQDFSRKRMPWLRSGFDLEGYVGALAAWLVGILLGILWGPLFWIGFVAAVVILFATRTAERTPPRGDNLIISPCDGIVVSTQGATPPSELRLDGEGWTRLRISAGPTASNGIYAPIDGAVDHIIQETGDPTAFAATKPDRLGLAGVYISLESGERATGMRLATGGLGPRLELSSEPGDAVRLGRNIGTMRLGGWCDIYVPPNASLVIEPGQTLIGGETVIAEFGNGQTKDDTFEVKPEAAVAPLPDPDEVASTTALEEETSEPELVSDVAAEGEPEDELTLEEVAETAETDAPADHDEDDDVKEMFARLRKEASKVQDDEP